MSTPFDKIYVPHAISEVLGSYFRFSDTNNVYGPNVCLSNERERIEQFTLESKSSYLVVINPTHGAPGILAYRLWLFLNQEFQFYKEPIKLTATALIEKIGLDKSKQRIRDVAIALQQLQHTSIYYHSDTYLKERSKPRVQGSFQLINVEKQQRAKNLGDLYIIMPHPTTFEIYRRKSAFYSYNWDRFASQKPVFSCFMLQLAYHLTSRLIADRHKPKSSVFYHINYQTFCSQWLGGKKPHTQPKRAFDKHLKKRLETAYEVGLITDETKSLVNGVIRFWPAKEFITDFQTMYPIKSKGREQADQNVEALLVHFADLYTGGHRDPHQSDYKTAADIIKKYGGLDNAKNYVTFATRSVKTTGWNNIQSLKAIVQEKFHTEFASLRPSETTKQFQPPSNHTETDVEKYNIFVQKRVAKKLECMGEAEKEQLEVFVQAEMHRQSSLPETQRRNRSQVIAVYLDALRITQIPTIEQWYERSREVRQKQGSSPA